MDELARSAQNILIVFPRQINSDIAAAASAIIKTFQDKRITIYSKSAIPIPIAEMYELKSTEVIEKLEKGQLVIKINKKEGSNIKKVKWLQSADSVQFFLTPDKNSLNFDNLDFYTQGSFDLAIFLSIQEPKIDTLTEEELSLLKKTAKFINIDNHLSNANFAEFNFVKNGSSLSLITLEVIEQMGLAITREALLSLFKGILWSSSGFRSQGDLSLVTSKIKHLDKDILNATSQMFTSLSVAELRYIGRMISNLFVDSSGVIYSRISYNDIQGIEEGHIIYPETNIISRIKGYEFAVVFSEFVKNSVTVRIYSNKKEVNVFELFSNKSPIGNADQIRFIEDGDINEIADQVLGVLKANKVEPSQEKVTVPLRKANHYPQPTPPPPIQSIDSLPAQGTSPYQVPRPINPFIPITPLPPKNK